MGKKVGVVVAGRDNAGLKWIVNIYMRLREPCNTNDKGKGAEPWDRGGWHPWVNFWKRTDTPVFFLLLLFFFPTEAMAWIIEVINEHVKRVSARAPEDTSYPEPITSAGDWGGRIIHVAEDNASETKLDYKWNRTEEAKRRCRIRNAADWDVLGGAITTNTLAPFLLSAPLKKPGKKKSRTAQ